MYIFDCFHVFVLFAITRALCLLSFVALWGIDCDFICCNSCTINIVILRLEWESNMLIFIHCFYIFNLYVVLYELPSFLLFILFKYECTLVVMLVLHMLDQGY